jgi:hypothetical protein
MKDEVCRLDNDPWVQFGSDGNVYRGGNKQE